MGALSFGLSLTTVVKNICLALEKMGVYISRYLFCKHGYFRLGKFHDCVANMLHGVVIITI